MAIRVARPKADPFDDLHRATSSVAAIVRFVCLLLAGFTFPTATGVAQEFQYTLGSGDQVSVTVFGHEDLSGEFEVSASGTVAMPLIGEVSAKGLSLNQLQTAITDRLKPDYLRNPRVAVNVLNYRPFYIFGEVKQPGSYPFVAGMRVVEAIALAGGFTYRARENDLLIERAGPASGKKEQADQSTIVMPGDVIEVPQRFF